MENRQEEFKKQNTGHTPLAVVFPRVLVVEDDRFMLSILEEAFERKSLMVTAQDAGKAVSGYNLFCPDLVLLDIGLPDKNGIYVAEKILSADPGAYIVIFSGEFSPEIQEYSKNIGIKDFISKPFTPLVHKKIEEHLYNCTSF